MFEVLLEEVLSESQVLVVSSDYKIIADLIEKAPPEKPFESPSYEDRGPFPSILRRENLKDFGITSEEFEEIEEYFSFYTRKYSERWEKILEKVIQNSKPSKQNCVLYRGMNVSEEYVKKYVDVMNEGKSAIIPMNHPSSWAGFVWVARKFYKNSGLRVLFQMYVPQGTKGVNPDWGDPSEVLLSKETKMRVSKIDIIYKNVYRFTGILV